jgi:hypothetical protein
MTSGPADCFIGLGITKDHPQKKLYLTWLQPAGRPRKSLSSSYRSKLPNGSKLKHFKQQFLPCTSGCIVVYHGSDTSRYCICCYRCFSLLSKSRFSALEGIKTHSRVPSWHDQLRPVLLWQRFLQCSDRIHRLRLWRLSRHSSLYNWRYVSLETVTCNLEISSSKTGCPIDSGIGILCCWQCSKQRQCLALGYTKSPQLWCIRPNSTSLRQPKHYSNDVQSKIPRSHQAHWSEASLYPRTSPSWKFANDSSFLLRPPRRDPHEATCWSSVQTEPLENWRSRETRHSCSLQLEGKLTSTPRQTPPFI